MLKRVPGFTRRIRVHHHYHLVRGTEMKSTPSRPLVSSGHFRVCDPVTKLLKSSLKLFFPQCSKFSSSFKSLSLSHGFLRHVRVAMRAESEIALVRINSKDSAKKPLESR